MRILYDYQIFRSQKFGGISRYIYELIVRLSPSHRVKVPVIGSMNYYLAQYTGKKTKGISFNHSWDKVFEGLNRIYTIFILLVWRPDIVHITYYNPYILPWLPKKTKLIVTAHDTIHERYADAVSADDKTSMNKRIVCKAADKIIAVSENTKKDFIDEFGIPAEKIEVIYLGNPFEGAKAIKPLRQGLDTKTQAFPESYILFVGQRDWYKNFLCCLQAIASFMKDNTIHLVCVGGPVFSAEEKESFIRLEVSSYLHYVQTNDDLLKSLYANALLFIYPSLYEGFGIPILEAWAMDCPVVLQDNPCFREIAGDGALFFDSTVPATITDAVKMITTSKAVKDKVVSAGKRALSKYSFSKTAEATEKVYKNMVYGNEKDA